MPVCEREGLQVYPHRPWACRMYPLGMAEPQGPNAALHRFYFLVEEKLCHGHGAGEEHSVREWIGSREPKTTTGCRTPFLEFMSHPGFEKPESLSAAQMAMYYMALYDLDRFRSFVFDTRFLELFEIDETRIEALDHAMTRNCWNWPSNGFLQPLSTKSDEIEEVGGCQQPGASPEQRRSEPIRLVENMVNTSASNGKCNTVLVVGGGIAGADLRRWKRPRPDRGGAGREVRLPGRPGGRIPPVFSQAVSARLRTGNQLQAAAEQSADDGADAGGVGEPERRPGRYEAVIRIASALCDRGLHHRAASAPRSAPAEIPDEFKLAEYEDESGASAAPVWPILRIYVVDRAACAAGCQACVDACKYDAIDLEQSAGQEDFARGLSGDGDRLGSRTMPRKLDNLGFGKYPNVVTNVMLERLAAADGPTGGQSSAALRRQAAQVGRLRAVRRVARPEPPALLLGGVLHGLAQAGHLRSQLYPEAKITMFYIDLRTPGQLEEFARQSCAPRTALNW